MQNRFHSHLWHVPITQNLKKSLVKRAIFGEFPAVSISVSPTKLSDNAHLIERERQKFRESNFDFGKLCISFSYHITKNLLKTDTYCLFKYVIAWIRQSARSSFLRDTRHASLAVRLAVTSPEDSRLDTNTTPCFFAS